MEFPSVAEFEAFTKRLMNHDWYYCFSDDHSVYRRGVAAEEQLEADSKAYSYFSAAYQAYRDCSANNIRGGVEPSLRQRRDMIIQALRDGLSFHHHLTPEPMGSHEAA